MVGIKKWSIFQYHYWLKTKQYYWVCITNPDYDAI